MIPDFWLIPMLATMNTVLTAVITGGSPVIEVYADGLAFGVEYPKPQPPQG